MKRFVFLLLGILLMPSVSWAIEYFVDSTPATSPATNCTQAQTVETAHDTIAEGLACLSTSDTLTIKAGTYAVRIPAFSIPSGTVSVPTLIRGAEGETVTLQPSGTGTILTVSQRDHITFDNIVIDGANISSGQGMTLGDNSNFIRFQNGVIKNILNAGACVSVHTQSNPSSNLQFVGNEVFNCKNPLILDTDPSNGGIAHGIYLRATVVLIEENVVHDSEGYGITSRSCSDTGVCVNQNSIVRNNVVYNNVGRGIHIEGDNALVYNNVIYNNNSSLGEADPEVTSSVAGVFVSLGSVDLAKIYNNTIYNTNGYCIWFNQGDDHIARNNICRNNSNNTIQVTGGVTVTQSNNFFTDPLFVDPGAANFRVQSGSGVIDTGFDLSGVFTTDHDGNTRDANFDIGAFEFGTGGRCVIYF